MSGSPIGRISPIIQLKEYLDSVPLESFKEEEKAGGSSSIVPTAEGIIASTGKSLDSALSLLERSVTNINEIQPKIDALRALILRSPTDSSETISPVSTEFRRGASPNPFDD